MDVTAGGTFTNKNSTLIGENSKLRLTDSSLFMQGDTTTFTTSSTSMVELLDSSGIYLTSVEIAYFRGYLYVADSVLFQSNALEFDDATVLFEAQPQLQSATFSNVTATFIGGFASTGELICSEQASITIIGSISISALSLSEDSEMNIINATGSIGDTNGAGAPGLLIISSSNIAISASQMSPVGVSLNLLGSTSLSLQNIVLNNTLTFAPGDYGEAMNVSLSFVGQVEVSGNYSIPSQITMSDGHFTISGNLEISG
jgi:hypothetical protein